MSPNYLLLNANGTLSQLVEATEHASLLRNNSDKPNFKSICDPLPAEGEVTLIDLLSRIPEARSQLMRWRVERNAVAIWPQGKQANGAVHIRVDAPYTKEDVTAVLGGNVTFVSQQGGVLTYATRTDFAFYCTDYAGPPWDIGTLVALRPMPGGLELSKLAMAFAASYALGMLVRYYPSHWGSMLQNVKHDGALPTLLAVLEHIEHDVPRMVAEFLERPSAPWLRGPADSSGESRCSVSLASVARMERGTIRVSRTRHSSPGFRFAPSELRLNDIVDLRTLKYPSLHA